GSAGGYVREWYPRAISVSPNRGGTLPTTPSVVTVNRKQQHADDADQRQDESGSEQLTSSLILLIPSFIRALLVPFLRLQAILGQPPGSRGTAARPVPRSQSSRPPRAAAPAR